MTIYKFVGDGEGVPGLPHELSQAEVNAMKPEEFDEFSEALSMGLYVEIESTDQGDTP